MSTFILNREFQHPADGWYHIEAKGNHPNQTSNVVQVIDDAAMASIVERFNADAEAGALRHGSEMLIDHEHFSDQSDQESRAYGWLLALQRRADGIYGRVRWTTTGQAAVDGGDYRFFSTEYAPQDLAEVRSAELESRSSKAVTPNSAPRYVRPLRLEGLTLTNMNNNRGQNPITNRAPQGIPPGPGTPPPLSADAALASRLKNRADQLKSLSPGRPFDDCWNQAKYEIAPPALPSGAALALRLKNRADSLKGIDPRRSFESCWGQAKGEIR